MLLALPSALDAVICQQKWHYLSRWRRTRQPLGYPGSAGRDMLEIVGRTTQVVLCHSKPGPVFFCASTVSSKASLSTTNRAYRELSPVE